jgi:hypothetical protein
MRCSAVASLLAYFFSRRQARSRFYRALLAGISNKENKVRAYYRQSEMFFSRPIDEPVSIVAMHSNIAFDFVELKLDGVLHDG